MAQENPDNWRDQVKALGKEYFTLQEMLRLGFLKMSEQDLAFYQAKVADLNKVSTELHTMRKSLEGVKDITPLLKEIRKNRIERVRVARSLRKIAKEQAFAEAKTNRRDRQMATPTYLGKGVSKHLKFEGTQAERLALFDLPHVENMAELAEAMQLTPEKLHWLCFHREASKIDHYTRFQIPKRKGGLRSIASPKRTLRVAQQWVLENILRKIAPHSAATAFEPRASIVENAKKHLNQALFIRIDLKDFFPSLKFHRVKGLFQSLGYNAGMATVLGLLCTDSARIGAKLGEDQFFVALGDRYLPQGACTSPTLTNLICRKLDKRLAQLCLKQGWIYTRYADDLMFSHADSQTDLKPMMGLVKKIVAEEGFVINPDKTLVMRPHQRQMVTGLVVNDGELRVSKQDLKRFRAFLHQFDLDGKDKLSERLGKDAEAFGKGYWAFIRMINPTQAEKFTEKYKWLAH